MILQKIKPRHRLSHWLIFSIILWLIGAVSFTGLTLNLSWKLEEGGIIINEAGSLRKQIFHVLALTHYPAQTDNIIEKHNAFIQTLDDIKHANLSIPFFKKNHAINDTISDLRVQSKAIFDAMIASSKSPYHSITELKKTELFTDRIDHFVKLIESQNTNNIKLLRFFQFLLIAMVLLSAMIAMICLKRWVIRPLNNLNNGIEKIRKGRLSTRIEILQQDEFGFVSEGFNQMAAGLQDLYNNLEEKVNQKTVALEIKNNELSSLYKITSTLHNTQSQKQIVDNFLNNIVALYHADAGSVRLLDKKNRLFEYAGSLGLPVDFLMDKHCQSADNCFCGKTMQTNNTMIHNVKQISINTQQKLSCIHSHFNHFVVYHIRYKEEQIGILTLYFKRPYQEKIANIRLIETLCNQLGIAIESQRLILRDKQFAVVEERNLMAQELHDNIAQSLSFLNLQVQMLSMALKNNETDKINETLSYIQEGIKQSYDEVRELLINFRVKIHPQSFIESVKSVIQRFEKQTKINVELQIYGDCSSLDPVSQLQIVFILQEALSNVRKHANAQNVNIEINNQTQFRLHIHDDGDGFDQQQVEKKQYNHVGLTIMRERTQKIQGQLTIDSVKNQGTSITLTL